MSEKKQEFTQSTGELKTTYFDQPYNPSRSTSIVVYNRYIRMIYMDYSL